MNEAESEKNMYAVCTLLIILGALPTAMLAWSPTGAVTYTPSNETGATKEDAEKAILQAESDIAELNRSGFSTKWLNDTLAEAKKYYEGENYTALIEQIEKSNRSEKAKELLLKAQEKLGANPDYTKAAEKAGQVYERKQKVYEVNDKIRAAEIRIIEAESEQINLTEAQNTIEQAKAEFKEERIANAERLADQIDGMIEKARSENSMMKTIYRAGKETTVNFIKENWIKLAIAGALIILAAALSYNRILSITLSRKLEDLKIEKKVLEALIKKAQNEYYVTASITKNSYQLKVDTYKKSIAKIKAKLPAVQNRLKRISKMKRLI